MIDGTGKGQPLAGRFAASDIMAMSQASGAAQLLMSLAEAAMKAGMAVEAHRLQLAADVVGGGASPEDRDAELATIGQVDSLHARRIMFGEMLRVAIQLPFRRPQLVLLNSLDGTVRASQDVIAGGNLQKQARELALKNGGNIAVVATRKPSGFVDVQNVYKSPWSSFEAFLAESLDKGWSSITAEGAEPVAEPIPRGLTLDSGASTIDLGRSVVS